MASSVFPSQAALAMGKSSEQNSLQRLLDSLTVIARWWKELDFLEIDWTAGPIDIADGLGKELALRYSTNLSTGSTFYTDANGREFQERVLNHRQTWKLNITEPVSGNYYPLTSAIAVKVVCSSSPLNLRV